jgi:predicted RND superfamily exporter protein
VVVVFCLLGTLRLRVDTNPVGYFRADTPVSRNFNDIYQHLSGCFPVNVELVGSSVDFFQTPAHIAAIDRMAQFAESLPGVDKAVSFAGYLKLVNYAINGYDPGHYQLPEESFEARMLINGYRSLLGSDMLKAFMDERFERTNILLLTHLSSSQKFLDLRRRIAERARSDFSRDIQFNITGLWHGHLGQRPPVDHGAA